MPKNEDNLKNQEQEKSSKLDISSFNAKIKETRDKIKDLDDKARLLENSSLPDSEKNLEMNKLDLVKQNLEKERKEIEVEMFKFIEEEGEKSKSKVTQEAENIGGEQAKEISEEAEKKIDQIIAQLELEKDGSFDLDHLNKVKFNALADPKELEDKLKKLKIELKNEEKAFINSKNISEKYLIKKEDALRLLEEKIKNIKDVKTKEGDENFDLMLKQEKLIDEKLAGEKPELIHLVREKIHNWNVKDSKDYFNDTDKINKAIEECQKDLISKTDNFKNKSKSNENQFGEDELGKALFGVESMKKEIKSFNEAKDLKNNPEFLKKLDDLKDLFQKNTLADLKKELINKDSDFLKKLEAINSEHGVDKSTILLALEEEEGKIMSKVISENMGRTTKIGKLDIPVKTLYKMGLFLGAGVAISFTTMGIGGIAAVGLIGKIDNYFKNKKLNKKLEEKKSNYYEEDNKLSDGMSDFILKKGLEKKSEEFFAKNNSDESLETSVDEYIENGEHKNLSPEVKKILREKLIVELMAENSNKSKMNQIYGSKSNGWKIKFNNILNEIGLGSKNNAEANLAWGAFFTGAAFAARQNVYTRTVLGAIGGWKLGGAVSEAIYGGKKQEKVKVSEIDDKIKSLKNLKSENNRDLISKEIDSSIKLLAKIDHDIESGKIKNSKDLLELKEKQSELKSYINLISIKFRAEDTNDFTEQKLMANFDFSKRAINSIPEQLKIKEKESKDPNKFKKLLVRGAGAALFASLSLLGASSKEAEESVASTEQIEESDASVGQGAENILTNQLESQGVNVENLSPQALEKLGEIGNIQKSVILESGNGVSKIFDGHMNNDYSVKFIDADTGEITEGAAFSKVVHPGDQVLLGEDGNVYVVCEQGVSDNPRFGLNDINDNLSKVEDSDDLSNVKLEKIEPIGLKNLKLNNDGSVSANTDRIQNIENLENVENIANNDIRDYNESVKFFEDKGFKIPEDHLGHPDVYISGEGNEAPIKFSVDEVGKVEDIEYDQESDKYIVEYKNGISKEFVKPEGGSFYKESVGSDEVITNLEEPAPIEIKYNNGLSFKIENSTEDNGVTIFSKEPVNLSSDQNISTFDDANRVGEVSNSTENFESDDGTKTMIERTAANVDIKGDLAQFSSEKSSELFGKLRGGEIKTEEDFLEYIKETKEEFFSNKELTSMEERSWKSFFNNSFSKSPNSPMLQRKLSMQMSQFLATTK